MSIEYDPDTCEIRYEGKVVGRQSVENGVSRVTLNIEYKCDKGEWVVPLSWFGYGLSLLEKRKLQEKVVGLTLETAETEIAEKYPVPRHLTEKTVKRDGFVWRFHKNDPDRWPSSLHGHDYEKNLKLDALTGIIYDTQTRQPCMKLNTKELPRIHSALRESHDFTERMTGLLGTS